MNLLVWFGFCAATSLAPHSSHIEFDWLHFCPGNKVNKNVQQPVIIDIHYFFNDLKALSYSQFIFNTIHESNTEINPI